MVAKTYECDQSKLKEVLALGGAACRFEVIFK
jgi:hypothetical protein